MKNIIITSVALIALVFAITVLVMMWSFWEPVNLEKDSLVYKLKVPQDAKQFPVWSQVTLPRYDISIADGEKPSATKMWYDSSLPLNSLINKAEETGFKCQQFETNAAICDKEIGEGRSQQLIFQKVEGDKYSNVKALFIGY